MKLRNKKTGAIYSIEDIDLGNNADGIWLGLTKYTSLAELCKDWEDVLEDKKYWYIDADGEIMSKEFVWFNQSQDDIGNRFETKEEAEKAVEKLKAWKRLKDNGFEFDGIRLEGSNCLIKTKLKDNTGVTLNNAQQFYEDVVLLFGDEE